MTKRKRENNAFIQKRLEKMQQEFVDLSLLNLPKNSRTSTSLVGGDWNHGIFLVNLWLIYG